MSCSVVVATEQSQKKSDTAADLSSAVHLLDKGQRAFAVTEDWSPSRFEDAIKCLGLTKSIERDRFKVAAERLEDAFEQIRLPESYESDRDQDSFHVQFH